MLADELRRLSPPIPEALTEITLPVVVLAREGTIKWLNAAALELFGDVRGRHYSAIVAPESQPVASEQFTRKVVGDVRTTSYDATFIGRDGRRLEAEVESVRLEDDGRVIGVFGVIDVNVTPTAGGSRVHLTPRQLQVLKLLAAGATTDRIATELNISTETVRNHVRDLLRALGVHSRVQAVVRAHELGIA
jgi:PAS domain S-box-containing protein